MTKTRILTSDESQHSIALKIVPIRGLGARAEEALGHAVATKLEERGFEWLGTQLAGRACADWELSLNDVVVLLHLFLTEAGVAAVKVAHPSAGGAEPESGPALTVHVSHPHAAGLCDLHRMQVLDAETVIQALGGFVTQASPKDRSAGRATGRGRAAPAIGRTCP